MPDISKINNVAVADISKLDAVTFAHGQKVNNQDVSLATDSMVLIEEQTIAFGTTDVGSITFDSGIDNTYDMFLFQFINIHAHTGDATDANFVWQCNKTTTEDYDDVYLHSSYAASTHMEDDSGAAFGYDDQRDSPADGDASLTTDYAILSSFQGTEDDEACSGEMYLHNLSDGSYSKPFHSIMTTNRYDDGTYTSETRGVIAYFGSTAIDDFNFKISTGNLSGTIKLWGWVIA